MSLDNADDAQTPVVFCYRALTVAWKSLGSYENLFDAPRSLHEPGPVEMTVLHCDLQHGHHGLHGADNPLDSGRRVTWVDRDPLDGVNVGEL